MNSQAVTLDVALWVQCIAVGAGALFGAFSAINERMAFTGVFALALVGGVGGGLIRDTLLQVGTPLALTEPIFLGITSTAAVLAIALSLLLGLSFSAESRVPESRPQERGGFWLLRLIMFFDAIAVGVYAIVGADAALNVGLPVVGAVLVGVLSGTGGSILLDLLIGRPPALLRPGLLLGVAASIGCGLYCLALALEVTRPISAVVCAAIVAGLRVGAVVFGWSIGPVEPRRRRVKNGDGDAVGAA